MGNFFRFPSTPHLAWLGEGKPPRGDKLLSASEGKALLKKQIVIEEKIDGANIGLSMGEDGIILVQSRGDYIREPYIGQFRNLKNWLYIYENMLKNSLNSDLVLFGEWCAAKHSISYDRLPDWFLLFDVYDRRTEHFWCTEQRNVLAGQAGLVSVPSISLGATSMPNLIQILEEQTSRYGSGPMEGVVVRLDSPHWCEQRAKLVRGDFTQMITEHWSRRRLEWNHLDCSNSTHETVKIE